MKRLRAKWRLGSQLGDIGARDLCFLRNMTTFGIQRQCDLRLHVALSLLLGGHDDTFSVSKPDLFGSLCDEGLGTPFMKSANQGASDVRALRTFLPSHGVHPLAGLSLLGA